MHGHISIFVGARLGSPQSLLLWQTTYEQLFSDGLLDRLISIIIFSRGTYDPSRLKKLWSLVLEWLIFTGRFCWWKRCHKSVCIEVKDIIIVVITVIVVIVILFCFCHRY